MPGGCRMGIDIHFNPADSCGCPSCSHVVMGPATTGSPNVNYNGYPALRAEGIDQGVHAGCCGSNTWATLEGSPNVFVNGYPAVRKGDADTCCGGGSPHMITGSDNVIIN